MPSRPQPRTAVTRRALLRRAAAAAAVAPALAALAAGPAGAAVVPDPSLAGDGCSQDVRAAVTVAAHDAGARSRSSADYRCDGANDDAQVARAIAALPPAGGRVLLSEGTFIFPHGVSVPVDRPTRIEGQGPPTRIRYGPGAPAFAFAGAASDPRPVVAIDEVDLDVQSRVTRLTVDDASAFHVNDICKIYSDDARPYGAAGARNYAGELFEVRAVDASKRHVLVHGLLRLRYAGRPLVRVLERQPVSLRSLWIEADGDVHDEAIARDGAGAVSLQSLVRPQVADCHIHSAWDTGLKLANCWMADVDVTTDDIVNAPAIGAYGYGVEAYGANYAATIRVQGEGARHLFTTGYPKDAAFEADRWAFYGEPIATLIHDSLSVNARGEPFDTHESGIDTTFVNCRVREPRTPPGGGIIPTGFQDRAAGTRYVGCSVSGASAGWKILARNGDGDFRVELDGCTASDLVAVDGGRPSAGIVCEAAGAGGEIVLRNFSVRGAHTGVSLVEGCRSRVSVFGGYGSALADAFADLGDGTAMRVVNAYVDRATPFKMRGESALDVANVYVARTSTSSPRHLVHVASAGAKRIAYANIASDLPGMGIVSSTRGVQVTAGGGAVVAEPFACTGTDLAAAYPVPRVPPAG